MWTRRMRVMSPWTAILVFGVLTVGLMTGCDREEYDPEAVAQEAQEHVDRSHQYTMRVEGSEIDVGEESAVELLVLPGPDLKINNEFPWSIEFDEIDGLVVERSKMNWNDMELQDEQATIPVSVTAKEPGQHRLEGRADFSVCNDERCDILRNEPVELILEAQ